MAVSETTKLEAINVMLSTIGETPVNSLTGTTRADVQIAENILDEINRSVQAAGWHFNTERDVELLPDASNQILLPGSIARIDVESKNSNGKDIVSREGKLYDLTNHTFTFTANVKATVTYMFDFTSIPEAARYYITVRAARILQDRMIGSTEHHGYSAIDEINALAVFREAEGDTADHSIFDHIDVFNTINRGNVINRIS